MSVKVEVKCKTCRKAFMARVADRRRGWGKFCSKSCKAKKQEQRTGTHKKYLQSKIGKQQHNQKIRTQDGIEVGDDFNGITDQEHEQIMSECEMGWDAHKDSF